MKDMKYTDLSLNRYTRKSVKNKDAPDIRVFIDIPREDSVISLKAS